MFLGCVIVWGTVLVVRFSGEGLWILWGVHGIPRMHRPKASEPVPCNGQEPVHPAATFHHCQQCVAPALPRTCSGLTPMGEDQPEPTHSPNLACPTLPAHGSSCRPWGLGWLCSWTAFLGSCLHSCCHLLWATPQGRKWWQRRTDSGQLDVVRALCGCSRELPAVGEAALPVTEQQFVLHCCC